ncbi:MAG: cbb3-type cytochrome oxidase assembly protein CcoS [bacterium]|nr:cbb3-type cytochrome oxidase assembly protein CcoS [bacterium]
MEVIYGLIPAMILLGLVMVGVFIWAVKTGQFDDMDGAANRILMDDDDAETSEKEKKSNSDK